MGDRSPDETEHLIFNTQFTPNRKTPIVVIWAKKGNILLGTIRWHGAWRRYCFFPADDTLFDTECLFEIRERMWKLMEQRKNG